MIPVDSFRNRTVAVFGLARSGLASVRALVAGGARVLAWDDKPAQREAARALGAVPAPPDAEGWRGAAALVLSPGVPLTHPAPHPAVLLARELGMDVLGDVELFARLHPAAPVVAVTGTNGKSTTTALIGHLLAAERPTGVGGNLGTAVLDLEPLPAGGAYVLELSTFQIDLTRSLRPRVAVWLNLTPDHIDRHGDLAGYIRAKRRLLEMAPADATLAIGIDDATSAELAETMSAYGRRVVRISVGRPLEDGVYALDGTLFRAGGGRAERLASLAGIETLRGAHNAQNAAAAAAAVLALGFPAARLQAGLASFPGLAHRMERVAEANGIGFVNDSKATNADATARALASFETIYWIAGGLPKAGGLAGLEAWHPRIRRAFLIGKAAPAFAGQLGAAVPHEQAGDLETALEAAYAAARAEGLPGAVVLLSPACASYDQFDSFEHRGDRFRALARALAARESAPARAAGGASR